jgi:hypothetical protein
MFHAAHLPVKLFPVLFTIVLEGWVAQIQWLDAGCRRQASALQSSAWDQTRDAGLPTADACLRSAVIQHRRLGTGSGHFGTFERESIVRGAHWNSCEVRRGDNALYQRGGLYRMTQYTPFCPSLFTSTTIPAKTSSVFRGWLFIEKQNSQYLAKN